MKKPVFKFDIFLIVFLLFTLAMNAMASEKIWGSYKKKQNGHTMNLSVEPSGGNEKSGKVIVMLGYMENSGQDLEIDGVGIRKGDTVTLYSGVYKVTATLSDGVANLKVEESCGDHRFYDGYGHYRDQCSLNDFPALSMMSRGLTKKN